MEKFKILSKKLIELYNKRINQHEIFYGFASYFLICFLTTIVIYLLRPQLLKIIPISNDPKIILISVFLILFIPLLFFPFANMLKFKDKKDNTFVCLCMIVFWFFIFLSAFLTTPELLAVGATIILVLVTAHNSRKTEINNQIVREMQNEPRPIIEIDDSQLNEGILSITIENYGNGLTKEIRFGISPPEIQTVNGEIIMEIYNIKNGIQYLAPRQRITLARIYGMDFICYLERKYEGLNREELIQKVKENEILEIQLFYYTDDLSKRTALFKFDLLTYWGPMIPI